MKPPVPVNAPRVKGACPGLVDPMPTGDGLLTRVRPAGRGVTAEQWQAVVGIADSLGNGTIELTSRANIQLRGLSTDVLDTAITRCVEVGLSSGDSLADQRRGVVTNPLAGNDPTAAHRDVLAIVGRLIETLTAANLSDLPAKWSVVVDDSGAWPLDNVGADVRLIAVGNERWAARTVHGDTLTSHPIDWVTAFATACHRLRCRGRDLTTDMLADLFPEQRASVSTPARRVRFVVPGRRPGIHGSNVVTAPFLGVTSAAELAHIATLSATTGVTPRLTPARGLAWCGATDAQAERIESVCRELGWLVSDDDRRFHVSACIGSRGCDASHINTTEVASSYAAAVDRQLHVSGCVKQCGAPTHVSGVYATVNGMVSVDPSVEQV